MVIGQDEICCAKVWFTKSYVWFSVVVLFVTMWCLPLRRRCLPLGRRGCRTLSVDCVHTSSKQTYPSSHTSPVSIYSSFHFLSPFPLRLHLPHSNDRSYKSATDFGGVSILSWMPKSSFPLCVTRILDYAKDLDFQPGKSTRLCKITAFSAYLASQTKKLWKSWHCRLSAYLCHYLIFHIYH